MMSDGLLGNVVKQGDGPTPNTANRAQQDVTRRLSVQYKSDHFLLTSPFT
jgi:hypothetical protein